MPLFYCPYDNKHFSVFTNSSVLAIPPEYYGALYHQSGWNYYCNLTDHLGSVRAVLDEDGTILQATDYYPFGLAYESSNVQTNKYLYNGKELQDELVGGTPLGWLDYHARTYDPDGVRFLTPDPMAEKRMPLGSYIYCSNNPLNRIDIDGRLDGWWDDNNMNTRLLGLGQLVLGYMEAGSGVGLLLAPEPTTATKVAGSVMTYDGLDNMQAGARQLVTGESSATLTETVLYEGTKAMGGSDATAEAVATYGSFGFSAFSIAAGGKAMVSSAEKGIVSTSAAEGTAASGTASPNVQSVNKPNFIVTSKGEAIPIPKGASGPTPPKTGTGMVYTGGQGGYGINSRTTGVRIMDANNNQVRRVNYMNSLEQTVDPATGRTISNKDPRGHLPIKN